MKSIYIYCYNIEWGLKIKKSKHQNTKKRIMRGTGHKYNLKKKWKSKNYQIKNKIHEIDIFLLL